MKLKSIFKAALKAPEGKVQKPDAGKKPLPMSEALKGVMTNGLG